MPKPIDELSSLFTFIMLLSNFIITVGLWVSKVRAPDRDQDARITKIEGRIDDMVREYSMDKARISNLEKGNVVIQQSLLALMNHAINDGNIDELIKAKDNLQIYLTTKGL